MRIGELAQRVGVSADTVRFYERSGWLPRAARATNAYRDYREDDVDHLRLLIELRRLDLPLDDAARVASWCHSGHCAETGANLPSLLRERRAAISARIESLQALDRRLADLERHLDARSGRRELSVLAAGPCCDAAEAVLGTDGTHAACCGGAAAES